MISANLFDPALTIEQVQLLHKQRRPAIAEARTITDRNHPLRGQAGLFATTNIPAETIVCGYGGEVTPPVKSVYAAHLSAGLVVDATAVGSEGRFANDSSGIADAPNCCLGVFDCPMTGRTLVCVRTVVPIKRGEELLVSYGDGYWDFGSDSDAGSAAPPAKTPRLPLRPVWPKGFKYLSGMHYKVTPEQQKGASVFVKMNGVEVTDGAGESGSPSLVAVVDLAPGCFVGYFAGLVSAKPPKQDEYTGPPVYLLVAADGSEFYVSDCGSEARHIGFAPRGNVCIERAHHLITGEVLLEVRVKRGSKIAAGTALAFDVGSKDFLRPGKRNQAATGVPRARARKTPTKDTA